jgi:hypothetical protein
MSLENITAASNGSRGRAPTNRTSVRSAATTFRRADRVRPDLLVSFPR